MGRSEREQVASRIIHYYKNVSPPDKKKTSDHFVAEGIS